MDTHSATYKKKIWIDLENSPHVLFFNPIISELKRRGYLVVITARDYAQVIGLADLFGIEYKCIGRHFGKNKFLKVIGWVYRALQLIPFYLTEKPDMAFTHASRNVGALAKLVGLPHVSTTDYEHGKHTPYNRSDLLLLPEVIPEEGTWMESRKISRYPGIKEDVYVPSFKPNPEFLKEMKIDGEDVLAAIRPPATLAHYHNHKSEILFEATINYLKGKDKVKIVILPRTENQGADISRIWSDLFSSGKMIIPTQAINGLDLIWNSDLVISAGGTMIREAAALKIPAYSIFCSKIGAVDKYLSETGRLELVSEVEDIPVKIKIAKRRRMGNESVVKNNESNKVLEFILDEVEALLKKLPNH